MTPRYDTNLLFYQFTEAALLIFLAYLLYRAYAPDDAAPPPRNGRVMQPPAWDREARERAS